MFGLYSVFIALFGLASLGVSIWSWRKMRSARQQLNWPKTSGEVIVSQLNSDRLPDVQFRYEAEGTSLRQSVEFSADMLAAPNANQQFLNDYPLGKSLEVFYQPGQPQIYTLQPGLEKDDKLIFYIAILGFVFALGLILFAGDAQTTR